MSSVVTVSSLRVGCGVNDADAQTTSSFDCALVPTFGALRNALAARFGVPRDALVFAQTSDDSAATHAGAHVVVVVGTQTCRGGVNSTGLLPGELLAADRNEAVVRETLMRSDAPPAHMYRVTLPDVSDSVQMMVDMGFAESRARKALLLARGSLSDAVEWLAEHQDDADIDADLTYTQLRELDCINACVDAPVVASLRDAVNAGVCTFAVTGRTYCAQVFFRCDTCQFGETEGVCASCAARCHRNHLLSAPINSARFYCDCQATGDRCSANGVFK